MSETGSNSRNQVGLLNNLLGFAEEILFSMPLSTETIQKYEKTRNQVFTQANLNPVKNIKKLQIELYSRPIKNKKDSSIQVNTLSEIEKIHKLRLTEYEQNTEAIKWETLQKIQKSTQIVQDYENFVSILLTFIDNIIQSLSFLTGLESQKPLQESYTYEEPNYILNPTSDYETLISDIKSTQDLQFSQLSELKNSYKLKENSFAHFFDLLNNELTSKDFKIKTLENTLLENETKATTEATEMRMKFKTMEEMLRKSNIEAQNDFSQQLESLRDEFRRSEETISKQFSYKIQDLQGEKEKLNKKLLLVLEDQEKSQDKYNSLISQMKLEIQDLTSERIMLISQINNINDQMEEVQSELLVYEKKTKVQEKNEEILKNECLQLKEHIKVLEDECNEQLNLVEDKYRKIISSYETKEENIYKEYEEKIGKVEDEVDEKNAEIGRILKMYNDLTKENGKFSRECGEKSLEMQDLIRNINELQLENQDLREKASFLAKDLEIFEENAKKCYFAIKSKPRTDIIAYLPELLKDIPTIAKDRQWLINKVAELTSELTKNSKNNTHMVEISKQNHSQEFLANSIESFKALKLFEKSRSEILSSMHLQKAP
ncbi:hypothetical protein SteCoe_36728 [Stentor coeruleus]|uniref:Uncharacterized protein n=1 Tax=Stentor coeruleus TaxID=5963 RepID=A0A1R2APG6_9CILI|nr:hypothetical protein SteCoe_36728 [Stentor coeruleus]